MMYRQQQRRWLSLAVLTAAASLRPTGTEAFVVNPQTKHLVRATRSRLFVELPNVSEMRVGDMRKELESYGVSTKSFFEKGELVEALEKARTEGKEPMDSPNGTTRSDTVADSGGDDKTTTEPSSRSKRIEREMEKAKQMSVKELRKQLKDRGIRTTSFFEKSEFVRAYAEAVADGTQRVNGSGGDDDASEPYDPSYRDVTVLKMDAQSQRLLLQGGGEVIDVKAVAMR